MASSAKFQQFAGRAFTCPWTYAGASVVILAADIATGPYLQFPILFILPISLCAWYCEARFAYGLVVFLPLGRFLIGATIEPIFPLPVAVLNLSARIIVLMLLSYFIARTSIQNRNLKNRVSELVRMCAWSRTVEFQGEWISFEDYLARRFDLRTTHGISPDELDKMLGASREDTSTTAFETKTE